MNREKKKTKNRKPVLRNCENQVGGLYKFVLPKSESHGIDNPVGGETVYDRSLLPNLGDHICIRSIHSRGLTFLHSS